jgi:hypothetical protein
MAKNRVPKVSASESRGESVDADRLLDDWLGDEAEIDWFPEPAGTTGLQEVAERVGRGRRGGTANVDDLGAPASEAARIVRRRGAVGLVVLIVAAAAVIVALVVLGSNNRSGSRPTTPLTTSTPASTTTTTAATTTPQSSAQPAASLAIVLPAAGTLRAEDTGSAVKKLQQALSDLGFDPGSADGIFGPLTEHAVVAFQHANGLATDGIVGPKTAGKINAGLVGRSTG